jgi:predicted alpha/beta-fold hydrolase
LKKIGGNPNLTYVETADGGHCSFIGEPDGNGYDGRWAEREVVEFVKQLAS